MDKYQQWNKKYPHACVLEGIPNLLKAWGYFFMQLRELRTINYLKSSLFSDSISDSNNFLTEVVGDHCGRCLRNPERIPHSHSSEKPAQDKCRRQYDQQISAERDYQ